MIELNTKKNIKVRVPESLEEDDTPKFSINDDGIREYYIEHGYVVIKNLINGIERSKHQSLLFIDKLLRNQKNIFLTQINGL